MVNYPLENMKDNQIIKYVLKKPIFLSNKDERRLIDLLKENKLNEFYDIASNLIKGTKDVLNLYTYLINKLESKNLNNEKIKNHICWRLFNMANFGWLSVYDPEIIKYCKENTTDKLLLKEIKKIKYNDWFDQYYEFFNIENQIIIMLKILKKISKDI